MTVLEDKEYEKLIQGYLEGQYQEWLGLKTKLFVELDLSISEKINELIYEVREYLPTPLFRYAKGKIDRKALEEQIQRSIIFVLKIYAPIKEESAEQLELRKELLWLYIQKIFLDFETNEEFKKILHRGFKTAQIMELPIERAFLSVQHYHFYIRQYYSYKSFEQKTKALISMFSVKRLVENYNYQLPLQVRFKIVRIIESVVRDRVEMVFPSRI